MRERGEKRPGGRGGDGDGNYGEAIMGMGAVIFL